MFLRLCLLGGLANGSEIIKERFLKKETHVERVKDDLKKEYPFEEGEGYLLLKKGELKITDNDKDAKKPLNRLWSLIEKFPILGYYLCGGGIYAFLWERTAYNAFWQETNMLQPTNMRVKKEKGLLSVLLLSAGTILTAMMYVFDLVGFGGNLGKASSGEQSFFDSLNDAACSDLWTALFGMCVYLTWIFCCAKPMAAAREPREDDLKKKCFQIMNCNCCCELFGDKGYVLWINFIPALCLMMYFVVAQLNVEAHDDSYGGHAYTLTGAYQVAAVFCLLTSFCASFWAINDCYAYRSTSGVRKEALEFKMESNKKTFKI